MPIRESLDEALAPVRCGWCGVDPLYVAYHDLEWGVPLHEDCRLFEMLILEGAQAGLSWITVLRKREAYRRAFAGFDPAAVAGFGPERCAAILQDPGVVRNRLKVASAVVNARAFLAVQDAFGSFDAYLWRVSGGQPRVNHWASADQVPTVTPEALALSRDLQARGFKFVGPTIMYAFMQAVGLVNDHLLGCHKHPQDVVPGLRPDTAWGPEVLRYPRAPAPLDGEHRERSEQAVPPFIADDGTSACSPS
jgi:DNA-3-methyladenine glycosylase I